MIFERAELQRQTDLAIGYEAGEGCEHLAHSAYKSLDDSWEDDAKVEAESFDKVVATGPVVFRRTFENWESNIFEDSPTVADVLRAMRDSMKDLNDYHHIFFEGYKVNPVRGVSSACGHCGRGAGERVTFIDIHTGS